MKCPFCQTDMVIIRNMTCKHDSLCSNLGTGTAFLNRKYRVCENCGFLAQFLDDSSLEALLGVEMHNLQKETYRTKDGLILVYAEERGETNSWNVVLCNAKTGDSAVLFNTGVLCKAEIILTVFYDEFQNLFYVFSFESDSCTVLKLYDSVFNSCQTLITAKS